MRRLLISALTEMGRPGGRGPNRHIEIVSKAGRVHSEVRKRANDNGYPGPFR